MLHPLQVKKLNHLFKIIDFDHNGLVQRSDFIGIADNIDIFTEIIEDKNKEHRLKEYADLIWKQIQKHFNDPNLDTVNMEQWIQFMQAHFYGDDEKMISRNILTIVKKMRDIFDKDLDKRISRIEFMSIFVSFRVEIRFANKCFQAIDDDGDGKISYKELVLAATQFFQSINEDEKGNQLFGEIGSSHFSTKGTHL